MSGKDDSKPATPVPATVASKATLHFFTEVSALNRDSTTGAVQVSCADGTVYLFKSGDQLPKMRAPVVVTVEIEL